MVKRESTGELIWGVIVETEAYSQIEEACHGYRRRSKSNETLFGSPGRFYVYLTYGIYHCVNLVTGRKDWANGVLLRSLAMPNESERIASGPGLLAKRFGLDRSYDNLEAKEANNLWLTSKPTEFKDNQIVRSTRIGISQAKNLRWRWYLQASRSISKRCKGDACPPISKAWFPIERDRQ